MTTALKAEEVRLCSLKKPKGLLMDLAFQNKRRREDAKTIEQNPAMQISSSWGGGEGQKTEEKVTHRNH